VRAVIFDWYETLAAVPDRLLAAAFDAMANDLGLHLPPGEMWSRWRTLRAQGVTGSETAFRTFRAIWKDRAEQLLTTFGVAEKAELVVTVYMELHAQAALYDDARRTVSALREGGILVAVVSDADDAFLRQSVARSGLVFEAVVSSEEVGAYKPSTIGFRQACAALGVEADDSVFVGDRPSTDLMGARAAGMRAIWLNRFGSEWPADLAAPDAEISRLTDLLTTLQQLGK
jgi:2-haloalkanoic acid dehalogenase type II